MIKGMEGCFGKLMRAQESLDLLATEIQTFNRSSSLNLTIRPELAPDGLEYFLIASGKVDIPMRFSILAGEIVHHLRSALDHLVCCLVLANGKTVNKAHQFPICTTREQYARALERGLLRGIRKSALGIVESQQPFKQPEPANVILAVVQELDNQDKHRMLLLTGALTTIQEDLVIGSPQDETVGGELVAITAFGNLLPVELVESGAKVFSCKFQSPVKHFYVGAEPKFDVALKQCGNISNAHLIGLLTGLLAGVHGTAALFTSEI